MKKIIALSLLAGLFSPFACPMKRAITTSIVKNGQKKKKVEFPDLSACKRLATDELLIVLQFAIGDVKDLIKFFTLNKNFNQLLDVKGKDYKTKPPYNTPETDLYKIIEIMRKVHGNKYDNVVLWAVSSLDYHSPWVKEHALEAKIIRKMMLSRYLKNIRNRKALLIGSCFGSNVTTFKKIFSDLTQEELNTIRVGKHGDTLLHLLVYTGKPDMLRYLENLKKTIDFNGGCSPLYNAIELDDSIKVEEILQKQNNQPYMFDGFVNKNGFTPAEVAYQGRYDVRYEILTGRLDCKFDKPLFVVVNKKNLQMFKLLVENGANTMYKHWVGRYLKEHLVLNGPQEMLDYLNQLEQ